MQKILFKAKRIEDNEWVYGYLWIGNDHAYLIPSTAGIRYDDETHFMTAYAYEIDKSTICLYTGMHGRDGERIWENDIVKLNNLGYEKRGVYAKVEFNDGCFDVVGDGWRDYLKCYVANHSVEVCGNIFDNPELLEV